MVLHFMLKKDFLLHGTYLQKTLQILTYAFDWLYSTQCLTFFFLYRSSSSSLCPIFDSISSNIDDVLSINPSAVFIFADFNVHHKDWLTYSGGTDRPGEVCYNFSIPNDLTQLINFPTRISDCDSQSPALLDLFISCCQYLFYNGFPFIGKF